MGSLLYIMPLLLGEVTTPSGEVESSIQIRATILQPELKAGVCVQGNIKIGHV